MPTQRRVLVVVRTLTSLNRALDVLAALADDSRIEVVFTVDRGSAFGGELDRHLGDLGARVIGWEQAAATPVDLVVAASDRSDLRAIAAPVLLVPHGAGFQKLAAEAATATGSRGVSGLARAALRRGNGSPTRVVLPHESLRPLVAEVDPAAASHAVVAGDPCLERLRLSQARRDRYRSALGVGPGQRLVALTSTWGRGALLGRHPDLALRALAELPYDDYRVCAMAHPNVWAFHGGFQMRHWLARALDAGLVVLDPVEAWQAGLVAADVVIGDHGSTTVYALALGTPVILGAFADEEVVPGSVTAHLGRTLPRLDHGTPLADQIAAVLSDDDPSRNRRLVEDAVAPDGSALTTLGDAVYELLHLASPRHPPRPHPIAVPDVLRIVPRAFHVEADTGPSGVTLRRYPAVVADFAHRAGPSFLAVDDVFAEPTLAESASVLVDPDPRDSSAAADETAAALLAQFPASRMTAVALTDDAAVVVHWRAPDAEHHTAIARFDGCDITVATAALHAALVATGTLPDLLNVTYARRAARVSIAPGP